VLTALQEVEDALSNDAAEQRRAAALQRSVQAARGAIELARQEYRSGLTNFTTVLNAEGALFSAEDQSAQSSAALAQDLVALYKALGGGWNETDFAAGDATTRAP
jgi:outer membrane protein TolC